MRVEPLLQALRAAARPAPGPSVLSGGRVAGATPPRGSGAGTELRSGRPVSLWRAGPWGRPAGPACCLLWPRVAGDPGAGAWRGRHRERRDLKNQT